MHSFTLLAVATITPLTGAFFIRPTPSFTTTALPAVGIFFGTSTGNTEDVAIAIQEAYPEAEGPFSIDEFEGELEQKFKKYDGLIVGTPTWNTGASTERSGTAWDELYYGEMGGLGLNGQNVAVFGLGDMASYGANYADASGELFDVFEKQGAAMYGQTEVDGSYEHTASKAQRGDKFVGLMCDQMNQDDLTEERVENWVKQLQAEGFGKAGGGVSTPAVAAPAVSQPAAAAPVATRGPAIPVQPGQEDPAVVAPVGVGEWKTYYNAEKKETMYVDPEGGREAYYVKD